MFLEKLRSTLRFAGLLPVLIHHRPDRPYTVADRFEERVREYDDRPFVSYAGESHSWTEVNRRTNRVAHWAAGQGLVRGDVVALLMENRPDYICTWMGLAKLGIVAALINTNLRGRALDHALRTAGARHLVVGSECVASLATASPDIAEKLDLWVAPDPESNATAPAGSHDLAAALAEAEHENPDASLRRGLRQSDDLFYIYTSGTTGNPKAARFSHLRFFLGGDAASWAAGTTPEDVEYLTLPLYHTAGGVVALGRALHGGSRVVLRRRFSASRFWDEARQHGATTFQYIGELCRYLLAQPERDDDADHSIRVALGNGMRPDVWETFQKRFGVERIIEFYGATEGNAAMFNLDGKVGAVGRFPFQALTNIRLIRYDLETDSHPRDERGLCIECADDEPGELVARIDRTPHTRFEGYTSEAETERTVLRDVFRKGDSWFRSGDLLSRDADGYYYFVDRIGDTFRWKGENVSTQEVAEILAGFPGLDMINVYGVRVDGADGRAGMMAFVPRDGAAFDGRALFDYVEKALPAYAAPVFVRQLPEAEVTGTFKLRKVDLQREAFDPTRIADPLFVRDEQARAYVPLDASVHEELRNGHRRL